MEHICRPQNRKGTFSFVTKILKKNLTQLSILEVVLEPSLERGIELCQIIKAGKGVLASVQHL